MPAVGMAVIGRKLGRAQWSANPDSRLSPSGNMNHVNPRLEQRFAAALAISLLVFLVELVGGWWTGSLALLSDSAHVFLDVFALGMSFAALRAAALPADDRHTYGWHRLEVLAALANAVTLLAVTIVIFLEAWERLKSPQPIHSAEMLTVAVVGLVANLFVAFLLHNHSGDLNTRSAFLHVLGDALASLAVIGGGLVILLTGWYLVDAIASVLVGLIIVLGSYRVLRSSLHILIEGTPEGISAGEVGRAIGSVPGVLEVHDLHLWSLCSGYPALSAHVCVEDVSSEQNAAQMVLLKQLLAGRFGIQHTTIQFEACNCGQGTVVCEAEAATEDAAARR